MTRALFLLCILGVGQGHETPAPSLKGLDFMVGSWQGMQHFNTGGAERMDAVVTSVIGPAVSGRFLEETITAKLPDRAMSDTRHLMTFDKKTGKFVAWWFNDTSSEPTVFQGDLVGGKLVMMNQAPTDPEAMKRFRPLRVTYEAVGADGLGYTLEMNHGDTWTQLFHSEYHHPASSR